MRPTTFVDYEFYELRPVLDKMSIQRRSALASKSRRRCNRKLHIHYIHLSSNAHKYGFVEFAGRGGSIRR